MGGIFVSQAQSSIQAQPSPSSVCNINAIIASITETLLAVANDDRKGLILYNQSGYTLYVKFGEGVDTNSFTVQISPGSTYEMQQNILYNGDIYGIWDIADGYAHITELM